MASLANVLNIFGGRIRRNDALLVNTQDEMYKMEEHLKTLDTQYDGMDKKYDELENIVKKEFVESSSFDGYGNNIQNKLWGSSNTALLRKAPSMYADGKSTLSVRGTKNPNPRVISNSICKATNLVKNTSGLTDMIWVWGQFVDHELDLTPDNKEEKAYITTDDTDPNEEYKGRTIFFHRSKSVENSEPREHPNVISSYMDSTNVYGATLQRNLELRKLDGSGKLKYSLSDNKETIMHKNTSGLPNGGLPGQDPKSLFVAGDVRSNENILLTSIHTIFVREHNRICDILVQNDPTLQGRDDVIFQKARRIVNAIIQKITYEEFLPAIFGSNMFEAYSKYDSTIDAGVTTEFSTIGFRLGHSMLSSTIQVGEDSKNTILLKDAFFTPSYIQEHGVNDLLVGATRTLMKKIDNQIIDDVRNFLFGPPTNSHLLDLATLNIQRGRDHGIPGYNAVRKAYGLTEKTFSQISSNMELVSKLENLYDTPNDIDPWIGALCEDHVPGSEAGELILEIMKDQFLRARNGDRFWYQNDKAFTTFEKTIFSNVTLASVLSANTGRSFLSSFRL